MREYFMKAISKVSAQSQRKGLVRYEAGIIHWNFVEESLNTSDQKFEPDLWVRGNDVISTIILRRWTFKFEQIRLDSKDKSRLC